MYLIFSHMIKKLFNFINYYVSSSNIKLRELIILGVVSIVAYIGTLDPVHFGMTLFYLDGNTSLDVFALLLALLHALKLSIIYYPILFVSEKLQVLVSAFITILVFLYSSGLYHAALIAPQKYFY